jgi:hypothetical protein
LSEYIEAEIKIGIHGNKATHFIKNSNGRSVELYASHFVNHPKTRLSLEHCYQGLITTLWVSLAIGILFLLGLAYFFKYRGGLQRGTVELRGSTRTSPKQLARLLKQEKQASDQWH